MDQTPRHGTPNGISIAAIAQSAGQPIGHIARFAVWAAMVALFFIVPLTGISCPPPCRGGAGTPLDEAGATINILQPASGQTVPVTARLTDGCGAVFLRQSGQAVEINGVALAGPTATGQYTADVPPASIYQITVREPTRGVQTTDVAGPGAFAITAPAAGGSASLSGFTLEWSGADSRFDVDITLNQSLLGQTAIRQIAGIDDTGSRAITANDLRDFRQGAPISITLIKRATVNDLNGFRVGTATVTGSTASSITPVP